MKKPFDHDPEAVTRAREAAGITKTALAKALECSPSLISEIENGTRNARPYMLERMAKVLGCWAYELQREPEGTAAPAAAVGVPGVRDEERADTDQVPELRDVAGGA